MSVDSTQVRQMAKSFIDSLERLTAKQREQAPTIQYANNFNRLLALAKEVAPNVDPRLWPEPLETRDNAMDGVEVLTRYTEIETYARQIMNHFPRGVGMTVA